LDNYPSINTNPKDSVEGNTPMHAAVLNNNKELV